MVDILATWTVHFTLVPFPVSPQTAGNGLSLVLAALLSEGYEVVAARATSTPVLEMFLTFDDFGKADTVSLIIRTAIKDFEKELRGHGRKN